MVTRRSILFAAAAALLLAVSSLAQTSPTAEGENVPVFSLTVDPPAAPITLGSRIDITVTLKNISGKEIYLSWDRGQDTVYRAFSVLLTHDSREVETTYFERLITGRMRPSDPDPTLETLSRSSISLPSPPEKMFVMTIDVTRLYEITGPGPYTLTVSRFDEYSKTVVHAKPLTLNIVR
jgi:hypothetical protein